MSTLMTPERAFEELLIERKADLEDLVVEARLRAVAHDLSVGAGDRAVDQAFSTLRNELRSDLTSVEALIHRLRSLVLKALSTR